MKGRKSGGQATLEYVLALTCMLIVSGILAVLVRAAVLHAGRAENLVTADCP